MNDCNVTTRSEYWRLHVPFDVISRDQVFERDSLIKQYSDELHVVTCSLDRLR